MKRRRGCRKKTDIGTKWKLSDFVGKRSKKNRKVKKKRMKEKKKEKRGDDIKRKEELMKDRREEVKFEG